MSIPKTQDIFVETPYPSSILRKFRILSILLFSIYLSVVLLVSLELCLMLPKQLNLKHNKKYCVEQPAMPPR